MFLMISLKPNLLGKGAKVMLDAFFDFHLHDMQSICGEGVQMPEIVVLNPDLRERWRTSIGKNLR